MDTNVARTTDRATSASPDKISPPPPFFPVEVSHLPPFNTPAAPTATIIHAPAGADTNGQARPHPPKLTADSSAATSETAGEAVDLLKLIDPNRNFAFGRWQREGDAIISPPNVPFARIQVPYKPPAAYELTAVVERLSGHDSFTVGYVVGDKQPGAIIDGWGNKMCGIATIDRRWGDDNESTVRVPNTLHTGKNTIMSRVHPGHIEVSVNDKKIIDWRGNWHRLGIDPRNPMPNREQLYLVTWMTSFRITTLELKPLEAK